MAICRSIVAAKFSPFVPLRDAAGFIVLVFCINPDLARYVTRAKGAADSGCLMAKQFLSGGIVIEEHVQAPRDCILDFLPKILRVPIHIGMRAGADGLAEIGNEETT
jgi:hypothetical protein